MQWSVAEGSQCLQLPEPRARGFCLWSFPLPGEVHLGHQGLHLLLQLLQRGRGKGGKENKVHWPLNVKYRRLESTANETHTLTCVTLSCFSTFSNSTCSFFANIFSLSSFSWTLWSGQNPKLRNWAPGVDSNSTHLSTILKYIFPVPLHYLSMNFIGKIWVFTTFERQKYFWLHFYEGSCYSLLWSIAVKSADKFFSKMLQAILYLSQKKKQSQ